MNEFEIRNYDHELHKNLSMIKIDCVICNREFEIPKYRKSVIKTCCDYCSKVALGLGKMKGAYKQCRLCDKPFWALPNRLNSSFYCSRGCANKSQSVFNDRDLGEIQTGRKKYYGSNWLTQRRLARERDKYNCQKCGISEDEYGMELSVHHKTPFVYFETYLEANKLDNLISLCEPCHRKEHSGENHHYKFETNKIVFNNELNSVSAQQRDLALKVVDLLLNTDLTLRQISNETGLSYGGVGRIYSGKRWGELYEEPPYVTNPRKKVKYKKFNRVMV